MVEMTSIAMKRMVALGLVLMGTMFGTLQAQRSIGVVEWNLPPDFVESLVLISEGGSSYQPEGQVDFRQVANLHYRTAGKVPGEEGMKVLYQGTDTRLTIRGLTDGESYTIWVWCRKGDEVWVHSKGKLKPKKGSDATRISINYVP